jgi:hypothetical protein
MGEIPLTTKPEHVLRAEAMIAELHESGHLTSGQLGDFVLIFDDIAKPRVPQPEEIHIEADLKTPQLNGVPMIGQDVERSQMQQAMDSIGKEVTQFLLREGFIQFVKYAPPGTKPRLRGILLAHRPPKVKKKPFVKPE